MRQAIYLFFYNLIRNEKLAVCLTKIAYAVVCLRYHILKWCKGKQIVREEDDNSRSYIETIEKKPVSQFEIHNCTTSSDIDVSIIIPVYNYESVLDEMICSVLNQNTTYCYEVILVDDGSREPAKQILRKYENVDRVTVIYQENQGISGARNTGLNTARGKYVMFVDCDDVVHENIIERLVGEAEKSNADIVIGGHTLVKQSDGQELSRKDNIYPVHNLENYRDGDSIMNYPGLPWGKVYKRELFEKVRFPVNYWYEDTIIQFILFRLAKKYVYIPEVLYDYRWYEGNYSKVQLQSNVRVLEHYWIVEYMLEECRRVGLNVDPVEYKVLLRHLGPYLYNGVLGLPEKTKQAVFNMACSLVQANHVKTPGRLNMQLRELESSFMEKDYAKWVLASTAL